ncbi:hypothetical protein [Streptomyces sp. NPDC007100]|uniref:hypothetical protein n=1 Tax=Streptomyces sp. NPDC007100 TaxID=3155602 RepID=UPI0033FAE1F2
MPDTPLPLQQPARRIGRRFFKPECVPAPAAGDRTQAEPESEREYVRPQHSDDLLERLGAELDRIRTALWSQQAEAEYGPEPRRC